MSYLSECCFRWRNGRRGTASKGVPVIHQDVKQVGLNRYFIWIVDHLALDNLIQSQCRYIFVHKI